MMVRERTRSLMLHSRLHRHKHSSDKNNTMSDNEAVISNNDERYKRQIKDLQDKLAQERDTFLKRDEMRLEQIKALVAQLNMLGVEPAVRVDNATSPISAVGNVGSTRRSLDISFRKKSLSMGSICSAGSQASEDVADVADVEDDEDDEAIPKATGANKKFKKGSHHVVSSSVSSSSGEETSSGPDVVVISSPRCRLQSIGGSSSSGSNASENNSVNSMEGTRLSRSSTAVGSSGLRSDSLGNEALQLRLHEMESVMEEQDALHQEEIDQLTQQLEDAKTLISQYQSLLSESEVALHRVETAAGLRSAIAAKHSHIALSEGELRIMSQNEQVKTAISSLLDAFNTSKAQNSGPTMHKVYDMLHELNDDSVTSH